MDCTYIDLYLIHWPGQSRKSPGDATNKSIRAETWVKLIEAKNKGLMRNIGVSNYNVSHLRELLDNCHGVKPAVNQVLWIHTYTTLFYTKCNVIG